ncbi:protein takeout-like [Thrips palmi]|uniref:Protein takeout-like n=1 Tax=Thrips palmi TaxID=161013 RepID=A0A6P9AC66_THRPL|nr:protein takeout-like [Thrips palmi]
MTPWSAAALLGLAAVVALVGLPGTADALKMPSYITACKKDDPNLNDCVVKAGRAAIPHFINGDRKYKIPNLNPLTVYDFRVTQGTRSVGLKIHMKEAQVFGLPEMEFQSAKVDLKGKHIEWNLFGKTVEIGGIYNVTGNVLILPITGTGPANITLKNCKFNYTFDFDLYKRADGRDYMKVVSSNLSFDTTRVYVRLENLFNGDKLLGENMNRFINENWREVTQEIGPTIADAVAEVFKSILTNISDLVPWEYAYV